MGKGGVEKGSGRGRGGREVRGRGEGRRVMGEGTERRRMGKGVFRGGGRR